MSFKITSQSSGAFPNPFPAIPGLDLRVRAQDLALSSGATVATWPDISGAGNNLTSGNSPLYYPGTVLDSLPLVSFGSTFGNGGDIITQSNGSYAINRQGWSILFIVDLGVIGASRYLLTQSYPTFSIGVSGGQLFVSNQFVATLNPTFFVPSGRRVAILVTFGPSAAKVYVDASTNVQSFAALPTGSLTGPFIFNDPSGTLIANFYEVATWSSELQASDASKLLDVWAPFAYGTGGAVSPAGRCIFDGDSTTQGIGSSANQNWPFRLNPANGWVGHDFAIEGQMWSDMIARQAAPNALANSTNWLFPRAGGNDLANGKTAAQIEADFETYVGNAITAGFQKSNIVALTTLNLTAGEPSNWYSFLVNNYATYVGHLVDLAGDPVLGVSPGSANPLTPSLWFDGGHYNDAGYALFAQKVRTVLNGAEPF